MAMLEGAITVRIDSQRLPAANSWAALQHHHVHHFVLMVLCWLGGLQFVTDPEPLRKHLKHSHLIAESSSCEKACWRPFQDSMWNALLDFLELRGVTPV